MEESVIKTSILLKNKNPLLSQELEKHNVPQEWSDLIKNCWEPNPGDRTSGIKVIEYLNENSSKIDKETKENSAVIHFKGLPNREGPQKILHLIDQQKSENNYSVKTIQFLLPMLENTTQMIKISKNIKDLEASIHSFSILSKSLGKPALIVFSPPKPLTNNNNNPCFTCVSIIIGQSLIWIDPKGQPTLDLDQSNSFNLLLDKNILTQVFVSKTKFLTYNEVFPPSSGPIIVEFVRGLLQFSLQRFLIWFEKIQQEKNEQQHVVGQDTIANSKYYCEISIQELLPSSLKTIQGEKFPDIIQRQVGILRQQHLSILRFFPKEYIVNSNNEVKHEEDYLENLCLKNTVVQTNESMIKFLQNPNSNFASKTFSEKVELVQSWLKLQITPNSNQIVATAMALLKKLNHEIAVSKANSNNLALLGSSQFTVVKELGSGAFGEVHKAYCHKFPVAIKKLKGNSSEISQDLLLEFRKEAELLSFLDHPNIVHIFGIINDFKDSPLCLVLEFAEKGGLDRMLRDENDTPKLELPSWDIRKKIVAGVSIALSYLHSMQIVHGDVRACNILVDGNYNAKLSDFGLAKQRSAAMTMVRTNERAVGVLRWISPQLLKNSKKTNSSDVYSFGMVLWEVISGKLPFPDISTDEEISTLLFSTNELVQKHHPIPGETLSIFSDLMTKCIDLDEFQRPTMEKISNQLFLEVFLPNSVEKYVFSQKNNISEFSVDDGSLINDEDESGVSDSE
jgi:hypothetical protein